MKTNKRMNKEKKKFDLQERFINYAVRIINLSEHLLETKTVKRIMNVNNKDSWKLDISCSRLEIRFY